MKRETIKKAMQRFNNEHDNVRFYTNEKAAKIAAKRLEKRNNVSIRYFPSLFGYRGYNHRCYRLHVTPDAIAR